MTNNGCYLSSIRIVNKVYPNNLHNLLEMYPCRVVKDLNNKILSIDLIFKFLNNELVKVCIDNVERRFYASSSNGATLSGNLLNI